MRKCVISEHIFFPQGSQSLVSPGLNVFGPNIDDFPFKFLLGGNMILRVLCWVASSSQPTTTEPLKLASASPLSPARLSPERSVTEQRSGRQTDRLTDSVKTDD